jgi:hypothetical protein
MRQVPDGELPEWKRMLRDRARRDAEELVPRPGYPIYGLATPVVTPAAVLETGSVNGEWVSITLAYGPWDSQAGPYVAVTSAIADPSLAGPTGGAREGGQVEELRLAIESDHDRISVHAEIPEKQAAENQAATNQAAEFGSAIVTREELPVGSALVVRDGIVWAARLLPAEGTETAGAVVTIVGRGVAPEPVRLTRVTDLRPMVDARVEEISRRIERRRREPAPPLPEIAPAEGVASLAALAEFTLATCAELRDSTRTRHRPRSQPGWGGMHNALWQRAVREQQRMTGVDARAADEVVTSVINHLGRLAEHAEWFADDPRLRAAAMDETLGRAMLGDAVRSEPAQAAWDRYWSGHVTVLGRDLDPADPLARMRNGEALTADWLRAWAA